jgi:hypothetical protein
MKKEEIREIFDNVIFGTDINESVKIHFPDENSAESARVQLSREKGEYTKRMKSDFSIRIQREYNRHAGIFSLLVTKVSGKFKVFKVNSEGKEVEVMLGKREGVSAFVSEEEAENFCLPERIPEVAVSAVVGKLKEEGKTDEEIEDFMKTACPSVAMFLWKEKKGE